MATLVMKFGGSLTSDARQLSRVAQVILAESLAWDQMVVVVSAMAGATDALSRTCDYAAAGQANSYRAIVASLRADHQTIIDALFSDTDDLYTRQHLCAYVDRRLFDVLAICDRIYTGHEALPRVRDVVMAAGEHIMTCILAALVKKEGLRAALVEAESLIVTDNTHQNAHPLLDIIDERVERHLKPILKAGVVPLVAGFVGATRTGAITTLGRGGSDYTATILAAALHADEVWMWTSVDGIMSADPALVPGARVIPVLSYQEVGELSYFGARVLHPSSIEPLAQQAIPLRVRNPDNLDHAGTLIQAEAADSSYPLKAVTAVDGLLLSVSGQPFDVSDFLGQIRHLVGNVATGPVILMQGHHRATLVFVIPTSEGPQAVDSAAQRLETALPRWVVEPVKVIAAIGTPSIVRAQIEVEALASAIGPGNRRLLAVRPANVRDVVRQLHKLTESSAEIKDAQTIWPRASGK